MRWRALGPALLLAASLGVAAAAPLSAWMQERTANMHVVAGRATQLDYGFSIAAPPAGLLYLTDGGGADHGMLVILGEGRDIAAYPDYIADPEQARPCRRSGAAAGMAAAGGMLVGGNWACVVTSRQDGTVLRMAQMAGRGPWAGIMYTLLLTTSVEHLTDDLAAFRAVAASFRFVPIEP